MAKKPVSQVPKNSQNRGDITDPKDVIQHFGSFKLGDSQTTNAAIPPPPQQDAANNAKNIKKQCDVVEQASNRFLLKQEQVIRQNHGEESFRGLVDKRDYNGGVFEPEFVGIGNSRAQPPMESIYGYPSTSNCENPSVGSGVVDKSSVIPNNRVYPGVGYGYMDDGGVESFAMDWPSFDLSCLHEILNGGDDSEISMLVVIFQGSYLDLISDRTLSNVFQKLLDYCRGEQLDSVVAEMLSCPQLFTDAAFSDYGASSIIKLIKRVKKSSHASSIAQALSTQFLAIMTHETARTVIQHCFNEFPSNLNEVLYEKAIVTLKELATDKVGCRSVNELMSTIAGEQRSRLLDDIVEQSYYLSSHPIGNYVVQNVLSLKTERVSDGIAWRLEGKCVELAKQLGGSYIVEKCIEASELGMVCVVREIVGTPKAAMELAQDIFGNHVIQTALKKTKECGYADLHRSLVKSLRAYCTQLNQSVAGNMVLRLLTDSVGTK